jgi:acid phosphatase (class A)
MRRLPILALLVTLPLASAVAQTKPAAAPKKQFELIDPATVQPDQMLPAPPAKGSAEEARELGQLHQLIAATTPERMAQARWDDEHEDPSIFDEASGRKLAELPATWALLRTIANDANLAGNLAKERFARTRPWGVDPTLPNCDAGKGKQPTRGYPSGHSVLSYSVGWALAQLMPEKATAILTRAQDYAFSREICGVHFPSDTEASHAIATAVAMRLFADPRLAPRIAAARAELAKR